MNNILDTLKSPHSVDKLKKIAEYIFTGILQGDDALEVVKIIFEFNCASLFTILDEVVIDYYNNNIKLVCSKEVQELKRWALFISWLYNFTIISAIKLECILTDLLLQSLDNTKAYIGGVIIKETRHVLILDKADIYGKYFIRIFVLVKSPPPNFLSDTIELLTYLFTTHTECKNTADKKFNKINVGLEPAVRDKEIIKMHDGQINKAIELLRNTTMTRECPSTIRNRFGGMVAVDLTQISVVIKIGYFGDKNYGKEMYIAENVQDLLANIPEHIVEQEFGVLFMYYSSREVDKFNALNKNATFQEAFHFSTNLHLKGLCSLQKKPDLRTCPFCGNSLYEQYNPVDLTFYSDSTGRWQRSATICNLPVCRKMREYLDDHRWDKIDTCYVILNLRESNLFCRTGGDNICDEIGIYRKGLSLFTTFEEARTKVDSTSHVLFEITVAGGNTYVATDEEPFTLMGLLKKTAEKCESVISYPLGRKIIYGPYMIKDIVKVDIE